MEHLKPNQNIVDIAQKLTESTSDSTVLYILMVYSVVATVISLLLAYYIKAKKEEYENNLDRLSSLYQGIILEMDDNQKSDSKLKRKRKMLAKIMARGGDDA